MTPRAFWFCIGLGAVAFILLANLSVSANGYDCGSVMSAKSYQGRSAGEFSSLDPSGSLGSSFGKSAAAANQLKADSVNMACDSARSSRRTFAIIAGFAVAGVGLGALRLRQQPEKEAAKPEAD